MNSPKDYLTDKKTPPSQKDNLMNNEIDYCIRKGNRPNCTCITCQPPQSSEWEKEFDKKFEHEAERIDGCSTHYDRRYECDCQLEEIKSFIKDLLAQQRRELEDECNCQCTACIDCSAKQV